MEPELERAAKNIRLLYHAMDGVLMCCENASEAYNLALVMRGKLRQIHGLITGERLDLEVKEDFDDES